MYCVFSVVGDLLIYIPTYHRVERKIAVTGDLSPAERKRLLEIAEMCPVHRTLESGSTVVVSTLVDA